MSKDPNDWPLEGRRPDAGVVFWYGRAELKQSDHRPVFGIFDVDILKLETDKREQIFEDALKIVGPADGSILLQVIFYIIPPFNNMVKKDHLKEDISTIDTNWFLVRKYGVVWY